MFQAVPAHRAAEQSQYGAVEMLEHFGDSIPDDDPDQLAAAGIVRFGKQPADHRKGQHRIELHHRVPAQIAAPLTFGPIPVQQTGDADGDQDWQKPAVAERAVYTVSDDGGEQRHEGNRHRQPVPEQTIRIRHQMIIGRPDGNEPNAGKEDCVGRGVRPFGADRPAARSQQGPEAHQADHQKSGIGDRVSEIREPPQRPHVGKLMVVWILWDRWNEAGTDQGDCEQGEKDRDPLLFGQRHVVPPCCKACRFARRR